MGRDTLSLNMEETIDLRDHSSDNSSLGEKDEKEPLEYSSASSTSTASSEPEREQWGRKLDFMLSCIGYAVGLGNIWRFPYLCYQNGGGAFLFPYIVFLFLCGMPLFFMELSVGQYMSLGPIGCWRSICPAMQGIGYAMLIISFLVSIYYNVIIAWIFYYLFESFRSEVPWRHCGNSWNTPDCVEGAARVVGSGVVNKSVIDKATNVTSWVIQCKDNFVAHYFENGSLANCTFNGTVSTQRVSASSEFWENYVLRLSDGIDNNGELRWQLALTLLVAWIVVYFCMWKGVKSSGKVVYFTATFPYVVLFVLFVRGVTLPGAWNGIKFYLNPDFEKLQKPEVWIKAATQIFYSLGIGFGSLVAMGSYNKFHNNCFKDAVTVSLINCSTSIFAGFVIFSVLGFMSVQLNLPVEKVASSGPGLIFVVYPEGISQMPISPLWAILFFFMLLTIGLDSQFGMMECVVTSVSDEYPKFLRKYKELFILGVCIFCYLVGLTNVTQAGAYILNLFDWQSGGVSLLFLAFFEVVCIGWCYGTERLYDNIELMTGRRPNIYWALSWKYFSPGIIFSVFIFSLVKWSGVTYNEYKYPEWAEVVGWLLASSSMICLPIGIVAAYLKAKGSLQEQLCMMTQPDPLVIKQIEAREGLPSRIVPTLV